MHFTAGCKTVEHAQGAHNAYFRVREYHLAHFYTVNITPRAFDWALNYANLQFSSCLYNVAFSRMRLTKMNIQYGDICNEVIHLLHTALFQSWKCITQQNTRKSVCVL